MTVIHEQPPIRAKKALSVIDSIREEIGEQFDVMPLDHEFSFLAQRLGRGGLWLADATTNHTGTFKVRGAYNKLYALAKQGENSVTAASAGNHLAGVALGARLLGMRVLAAVPLNAPETKLDRARRLYPNTSMFRIKKVGATVHESIAWAQTQNGSFVPPYDDEDVIAGQGTLANDLKAAHPKVDGVVVPIGGGGLVAGVAQEFQRLDPNVTVYGFEVEGSSSLSTSIKNGEITAIDYPNPHFSGLAVRQAGRLAFQALSRLSNVQIGHVIQAEVEKIAEEYLDEREHRHLTHTPLEPTSLVAIAGLASIASQHPDKNLVVIGTGRNEPVEAIWEKQNLQRSLYHL